MNKWEPNPPFAIVTRHTLCTVYVVVTEPGLNSAQFIQLLVATPAVGLYTAISDRYITIRKTTGLFRTQQAAEHHANNSK